MSDTMIWYICRSFIYIIVNISIKYSFREGTGEQPDDAALGSEVMTTP